LIEAGSFMMQGLIVMYMTIILVVQV